MRGMGRVGAPVLIAGMLLAGFASVFAGEISVDLGKAEQAWLNYLEQSDSKGALELFERCCERPAVASQRSGALARPGRKAPRRDSRIVDLDPPGHRDTPSSCLFRDHRDHEFGTRGRCGRGALAGLREAGTGSAPRSATCTGKTHTPQSRGGPSSAPLPDRLHAPESVISMVTYDRSPNLAWSISRSAVRRKATGAEVVFSWVRPVSLP